jgi:hypothetical protein
MPMKMPKGMKSKMNKMMGKSKPKPTARPKPSKGRKSGY